MSINSEVTRNHLQQYHAVQKEFEHLICGPESDRTVLTLEGRVIIADWLKEGLARRGGLTCPLCLRGFETSARTIEHLHRHHKLDRRLKDEFGVPRIGAISRQANTVLPIIGRNQPRSNEATCQHLASVVDLLYEVRHQGDAIAAEAENNAREPRSNEETVQYLARAVEGVRCQDVVMAEAKGGRELSAVPKIGARAPRSNQATCERLARAVEALYGVRRRGGDTVVGAEGVF
ncbi:hypothetical protein HDV00_004971 [Rhizophlyctis rosea]|nr:hypothetical protein HDV00_004971 [Rhizophlyctis rosea]